MGVFPTSWWIFPYIEGAISTNKIEELQSKVSKLELAQAVAGVVRVRYPSSMTYAYNVNPFCACSGCNGNI